MQSIKTISYEKPMTSINPLIDEDGILCGEAKITLTKSENGFVQNYDFQADYQGMHYEYLKTKEENKEKRILNITSTENNPYLNASYTYEKDENSEKFYNGKFIYKRDLKTNNITWHKQGDDEVTFDRTIFEHPNLEIYKTDYLVSKIEERLPNFYIVPNDYLISPKSKIKVKKIS